MLNRIAVSDGSYRSWLETVYTGGYTERTETPIYCGGSSAEIVFQEVVSTSAADQEPSYIIGLVSITPRLDYSQGNKWDMSELDTIEDLHKPALDGIGFKDLLQERDKKI